MDESRDTRAKMRTENLFLSLKNSIFSKVLGNIPAWKLQLVYRFAKTCAFLRVLFYLTTNPKQGPVHMRPGTEIARTTLKSFRSQVRTDSVQTGIKYLRGKNVISNTFQIFSQFWNKTRTKMLQKKMMASK